MAIPTVIRDEPFVGGGGVIAAVDAAFTRALEWIGGLLVLAEIAILLAGVLSRFVFDYPLPWSDGLAEFLFIWLAMMGSALALRCGDHMRMTAIVDGLSGSRRAAFASFGFIGEIVFLAILFKPAIEYAQDQYFMTIASLGISVLWKAMALPTGIGLMIVAALLRFARSSREQRTILIPLAAALVVAAALLLCQPAYDSLGNYNLVVFFVFGTAALVLAGLPIAFAFGLATMGFIGLTTDAPLAVIVGRIDEGMGHITLLAVPLFIFLGFLMDLTGMARHLVRFLASFLGGVRGGLAYVLIGAMYLVSGISGAKVADMAAVAPALFPEMRERGARPGELLALLAATGAQTETVPPSLVMITLGSVTGVSIAALFTGGLLPSAVLAVVLCGLVWFKSRGDRIVDAGRLGACAIGRLFVTACPALLLPILIRSAVIEGVATATEVSTIGIVYTAVFGVLMYRNFDLARVGRALVGTAILSGAILLIVGAATAMAWALTQTGFSSAVAAVMRGAPGGPLTFLLGSIVVFAILGSVLEGIPAIVLFGPLLFPIARELGINEVHYAVVVVLSMGIGLFSPPFGVGYYSACAVSRIPPAEGLRSTLVYMLALAIGVIVIALVPWISTGFL